MKLEDRPIEVVYFASRYSSETEMGRRENAARSVLLSGELMMIRKNWLVIPGANLSTDLESTRDFEWWYRGTLAVMRRCHRVVIHVGDLEDGSVGVAGETLVALRHGHPTILDDRQGSFSWGEDYDREGLKTMARRILAQRPDAARRLDAMIEAW